MKLAMVNTLQAGELLRRVFNAPMSHGSSLAIHRRSFLETGWTTKYVADSRLPYIGTLCRQSLMPASLQIASLSLDRCVRYCPVCLSEGVHYAEFQIASLARCPVHGQALLSSCRFCGAMTPRYAAATETFFRRTDVSSAAAISPAISTSPAWQGRDREAHLQTVVLFNTLKNCESGCIGRAHILCAGQKGRDGF
ncbi:hypothetical protein LP415_13890 [Polaromonas sp. P1(28)-8]|nr:hypothetical protein LP415_13890 [Polaromonas sp. P1(28)-8]